MSGTAGRNNVVQIRRTIVPNRPPVSNSLVEGELAAEMAPPRRLWIGVPQSLDPSGRVLLFDASQTQVEEAPLNGTTYGRNTGVWVPVDVTGIDGGTF